MSILEGKGLSRRYRQQNRVIEALRGVDFHLEDGEILGLPARAAAARAPF